VHFRTVGLHALLVEVDDAAAARSLAAWAREQDVTADEVVPAARTVLFDGVPDAPALREALSRWKPGAGSAELDVVEIPVTYDGDDLGFVAEHWGMSEDDAVATHAGVEYIAAFCGFAPGFAYLEGLPEDRAVPRLDSPRSKVPAGSVALAGAWSAVYPSASPGGWRLIGNTDVTLWDAARDDPALLPPGTRVRFVPR
jgi:KipI family sensor histidine kinase inhibitor